MLHNKIFSEKYIDLKLIGFDLNKVANLAQKRDIISLWIKSLKSGRINKTKETSIQADFLNGFFGDLLGYSYKSHDKWHLEKEYSTEVDGKFADGALGYFTMQEDKILTDVRVVIELKDANTDLDKPQNRKNDKRTPVEQAFSYATRAGGRCRWVIASNFKEIRLYRSNDISKYESFSIFELENDKVLAKFFYLLNYNQLFLEKSKSTVDALYKERQDEEEDIENGFYKDYKKIRLELFDHLKKNNKKTNELILFAKTQKILDRAIFVCFTEDTGLIPPYTFRTIIKACSEDKFNQSETKLWNRIKSLFQAIDQGYPTENINKFNGGLFAKDEILDNLIIKDEVAEHMIALEKYKFDSDLNVNILGHIFEQSISDIEQIKAEIIGEEIDASKGKRKKDGIFYTPEFVTRYIVQEAVGGWLEDRKEELHFEKLPELVEEDYKSIVIGKKINKETRKKVDVIKYNARVRKHIQFWEAYKEKLYNIKVLDPACGSGAFLNQVFDYLYVEGQKVNNQLARLKGGQSDLFDLEKHILNNNVFGIDLNPESVEITKLSLWLKTANKNKELSSLDGNIQSGNSLINDKNISVENAFSWDENFKSIMEGGGFDVIVGNPPYVGEKGHAKVFEDLKKVPKWSDFYRRRSNLYYFFIQQGIDHLKINGIQSLIVPREFISADWANKLRRGILKNTQILNIIDFHNLKVFDDAGTTSLILTHKKTNLESLKYDFPLLSINEKKHMSTELFNSDSSIKYLASELDISGEGLWNFYQFDIEKDEKIVGLGSLFDISQGLVTGADRVGNKHVVRNVATADQLGRGIFMLEEGVDIKIDGSKIELRINNRWVALNNDEKQYIKPYIKTEGLKKWFVEPSTQSVIYVGSNNLSGNVQQYLLQFAGVLVNRSTTVADDKIITLEEFEEYSIDEIKQNYSSAGAVQKIMKRKKWWLPLYERRDIPFSEPKIIVNTKNMDKFTYSDSEHYSSGGGSGGQNYIYPKISICEEYYNEIKSITTISKYVKYVNALLNSKLVQTYIKSGQYNQLSTAKIGDLPIYKIQLTDPNELNIFNQLNTQIDSQISQSSKYTSKVRVVVKLISTEFKGIKLPNKLLTWDLLELSEFLDEINALRKTLKLTKLTKQDSLEWIELYEKNIKLIEEILNEIQNIETLCDRLIFDLYNTSEYVERLCYTS